jgi:hypothetical protein
VERAKVGHGVTLKFLNKSSGVVVNGDDSREKGLYLAFVLAILLYLGLFQQRI